jgi:hypothetical protein
MGAPVQPSLLLVGILSTLASFYLVSTLLGYWRQADVAFAARSSNSDAGAPGDTPAGASGDTKPNLPGSQLSVLAVADIAERTDAAATAALEELELPDLGEFFTFRID